MNRCENGEDQQCKLVRMDIFCHKAGAVPPPEMSQAELELAACCRDYIADMVEFRSFELGKHWQAQAFVR